jgi:hypothetical protein
MVPPGARPPLAETTTDRNPGVVNKVGFAVGINCRILSGGFGTARWSNDYSQLTDPTSYHSAHRASTPVLGRVSC